ncbi:MULTISPECIES: Crp/Fnr family transcriptional regulator [Asaia]|uniref:Crp/Fnr family transcriptional regulator n=1 Tax=Asaia TaxID=91914 RepID=UPI002FC35094
MNGFPFAIPIFIDDDFIHQEIANILIDNSSKRQFRPGDVIVVEGSERRVLLSIISGYVSLERRLKNEDSVIFDFSGPGAFIGFVDLEFYTFTARCLSNVELFIIPASTMKNLMINYLPIRNFIMKKMSQRIAHLNDHVALLARAKARQRLALFLLERRWTGINYDRDALEITLPMSRADIANNLGLTAETVSRIFRDFEKEQIISIKNHNWLIIENFDKLSLLSC